MFRTADEDREIIFYSEQESYYAYFEGLISALHRKTSKNICYITSDPNDRILHSDDSRVQGFYLKSFLPFFMKIANCRVLVMTLTDLNQFHIQRSVNDVHYVYVFHAMNSTHMCYRQGAFDHYDSILCTGPYQVAELNKEAGQRKIRQRELVEAGYSRVERIHSAWNMRHKVDVNERHTVLIAPSWAASNVLEQYADSLIEGLLNREFNVVVRPHPETVKRYPELLKRLATMFSGNERFTMEHSVSTDDSLLNADVLITDWSGIALEYAFGTERPVIYVDVPRKVHNDEYESLGIEPFEVQMREHLGVVVSPGDLASISDTVDHLIESQNEFHGRIVGQRSENVFNFGHSSEIGAQHICGILNSKKRNEANA